MTREAPPRAPLRTTGAWAPALAAAALLSCPGPAGAARPMVTDDARTVDPDGCQVESFLKREARQNEHELWVLPACHPAGLAELTLGGQRVTTPGGTGTNLILQAKKTLLPLQEGRVGVAIAAGSQYQQSPGAQAQWAPYFYVAASRAFGGEAVVVHVNAGAARDSSAALNRATWGLGAEIAIVPGLQVIAETYGQEGDPPSRQLGLRWWVLPGKLQVDGTLGARDGNTPRRWTSVGLRALF